MGIVFRWKSRAGARTLDNRDHAGIGIRANEALCVVLDGSTSGKNSGALARRVVTKLIDSYVASEDRIDAESLIAQLRDLHAAFAPDYPEASASYMLALIREGESTLALHAGDCLIGKRCENGEVEWLCRPHTLANVFDDLAIEAIAAEPARHRLTRSFRAREFMLPDIARHDVGLQLVVATDGFWADLTPHDQQGFLDGHETSATRACDDCSVLEILITDAPHGGLAKSSPDNNLYIRSRVADTTASRLK